MYYVGELKTQPQQEVLGGRLQATHAVRVLVVDDSEAVRRGICRVLKSQVDIEVICEAVDGADAVRKAQEYKPDVVLMDVSMPVMNGLDAAGRIKRELPSTIILMVSQFDSPQFEREALAAGASGYIWKGNADKELVPALRKIQCSMIS